MSDDPTVPSTASFYPVQSMRAAAAPSETTEQRDDFESTDILDSDLDDMFDIYTSLSNNSLMLSNSTLSEVMVSDEFTLDLTLNKSYVWKADLKSYITIGIRVNDKVRQNPMEWISKNRCGRGGGGGACYEFSACLENLCTGAVIEHCKLVSFTFNANNYDFYNTKIENKLKVSIHQDAIQSGEIYVCVVRAHLKTNTNSHDSSSNFLIGRTNPITVKGFSLCIEECFENNPYVHEKGDLMKMEYLWYNSCGGEFSGLDVMVHLRNEIGRLCTVDSLLNDSQKCDIDRVVLEVEADLVYADDESEVPKLQIKPNKSQNTQFVFRSTRPLPIQFKLGDSSQPFSFRIDEVSSNHGKRGFKLRVKPMGLLSADICPNVMWETIYVYSKPRSDRTSGAKPRISTLHPSVT